MKRIFYFTGHRLSVLNWSGKQFSGACSFEPDADGFDKFRQYLESTAKIATKLLVDVIEEDFRVETIPHVFGRDRAAVISRLVDRYYRSSRQFAFSEIIGREKTGRKDNNVLLGALTNPSLIQPWLDVIDDCDVPLSGIWSLPLVSKLLLQTINAKSGAVLLVSQQVNSNLRQTFFRDGKMISSRQSVINQGADDITRIGAFAKPEVDRTIAFLRSQQLIGSDEVINVHFIGAEEQISSIEASFKTSQTESVNIHTVKAVEEKVGYSGYDSKFAGGIYAWLCLNQFQTGGHYGHNKEKERYFYTLLSTGLYAASILLLVMGLLLTEMYISNAIQYQKASQLLEAQETEYKKAYRNKFEAYEEVFANADVMNSAVDLADQIKLHSKVSPLDLYIQVSDAITKAQLNDVTIDSVNWKSEQVNEVRGKNEPVVSEPKVILKDRLRHTAVITGRIAISSSNYGASVDRIADIITALRNNERVESVEAIEMPVEVRPEKKFSAESGVRTSKDQNDKDQGGFSLRVIMSGVSDA